MTGEKILLVVPPFDFASMNSDRKSKALGGYYVYYQPLGLCYMAAALRRAGHEPKILDAFIEGYDIPAVVRRVVDEDPLAVGLTVTTPTLPAAYELVGLLKEAREAADKRFRIVAGGPHISLDGGIVFPMGADFGLGGETDDAILDFVRFLQEGERGHEAVPGLIYEDAQGRHIGHPAKAADLDALPLPARDLVNADSYFNPFVAARTTSFLSVRGCPYTCSFCARSASMGVWRGRSLDGVMEELAALERDGYGFVTFVDETFSYDRERTLELCGRMMSAGLKFRWSCQTRGDAVDREMVRAMGAAGCVNISFGVEAGSERIRQKMGKGLTEARYLEAFRLCREARVTTNAFMQIGSPGEGEDEIEESVRFVFRLNPDYVTYNISTVFPGAGIYESWLREGRTDPDLWRRHMMDGEPLPVGTDRVPKERLFALLRGAYGRFYMRPGYILRKLLSLTSAAEFKRLARQAKTLVLSYVYS